MHKPVIEENDKVIGDTRVIPIVEHEYDKIQWSCITSIYTDAGEPETLKEAMTSPNGNLWEMYAISEVNNFLSRKAWILTKIGVVKDKGRNTVPFMWVFKSKEEAEALIFLKSRSVVKGYMKLSGVEFTESLYPAVSENPTSIRIGLTL